MAGKSLALTGRDRTIILEIARFGFVSRDQLMRLRLFSSKTRANDRLRRLVGAGYLAARRQPIPVGGPRFVYAPGPESSLPRDARKRITEMSDFFMAHQLGLVDVRIAFEQHTTVTRWLSARDLATFQLGIQPDAFIECEVDGLAYCAFIEYDRGTETLGRIEKKVRAYLDAAHSGRFERTFKRRYFRTLFVTDTTGRLSTLSATAAKLTDKVLRFTTLNELSQSGPLMPIWRRPGGSSLELLAAF